MTPRKKATYPPPHVSKAARRRLGFRPMLEALEAREACNSLYNPLFGSAFLALDPLDVPYSVVSGDGSNSGSSSQGDGSGDGSTGGTGETQFPSGNFAAADATFAAATSVIDLNASLFDSVLNTDDASFAASVAAVAGGTGQSTGTPGVGAAVVIGLPGPATPRRPRERARTRPPARRPPSTPPQQ